MTRRNFALDAIAMAGTNPAITTLFKEIEQQKVHGEKAAQIAMTFALYIRHPTPEMIERFFVSRKLTMKILLMM
jgi:hypothetical protein